MCAEVGGVRGCLADARLADGVTITATRKGVLCCAVAAAAVAGCAVVVAVARWRWPDARWWLWLGGGGRVRGGCFPWRLLDRHDNVCVGCDGGCNGSWSGTLDNTTSRG
jgi:hypothetical protein